MTVSASASDWVRRFAVEHREVRGQLVRLGPAWLALREHSDYPEPVRALLGEAVAATVLLASTLKFEGELTLQLQGDGAVRLLVAQCTHDFRVRAVARFERERLAEDFATLAKQVSKDAGSAAQGGDLGWSERNAFVGPFADAVFAMKEGELRGPVKTEFGYHVVKLDGIEAARTKAFEEVRAELETELRRDRAADIFGEQIGRAHV